MQESLSALQENEPQQTEFGFEGYEEDPISEERFTVAENLTLTAITTASEFTDLFENARCISRIYSGKEDDVAGLYYIFRAHDAVNGAEYCRKNNKSRFMRGASAVRRMPEVGKRRLAAFQRQAPLTANLLAAQNNAGKHPVRRKNIHRADFILFFHIFERRCAEILF